jgi:hypothetical protein
MQDWSRLAIVPFGVIRIAVRRCRTMSG